MTPSFTCQKAHRLNSNALFSVMVITIIYYNSMNALVTYITIATITTITNDSINNN